MGHRHFYNGAADTWCLNPKVSHVRRTFDSQLNSLSIELDSTLQQDELGQCCTTLCPSLDDTELSTKRSKSSFLPRDNQ